MYCSLENNNISYPKQTKCKECGNKEDLYVNVKKDCIRPDTNILMKAGGFYKVSCPKNECRSCEVEAHRNNTCFVDNGESKYNFTYVNNFNSRCIYENNYYEKNQAIPLSLVDKLKCSNCSENLGELELLECKGECNNATRIVKIKPKENTGGCMYKGEHYSRPTSITERCDIPCPNCSDLMKFDLEQICPCPFNEDQKIEYRLDFNNIPKIHKDVDLKCKGPNGLLYKHGEKIRLNCPKCRHCSWHIRNQKTKKWEKVNEMNTNDFSSTYAKPCKKINGVYLKEREIEGRGNIGNGKDCSTLTYGSKPNIYETCNT